MVTHMKVAGENNHAEMMAGYTPAAEDTSTSCKNDSNVRANARADDLTDRSKGHCDGS